MFTQPFLHHCAIWIAAHRSCFVDDVAPVADNWHYSIVVLRSLLSCRNVNERRVFLGHGKCLF